MIKLYQFNRVWGLPNASTFCMKVETYLRMADIPYEIRFIDNPQKSPKGKLPYIKDGDLVISDSEFIIEYLKKTYGNPLDEHLNASQQAISVLVENVFAERLYWIGFYYRWQYEPNWQQLKKLMFAKVPWYMRSIIAKLVRKRMIAELYYQGTGRHNSEEVAEMGRRTLDALVTLLGDSPYLLGDKPSSVDASAFSFLANSLWSGGNDPIKDYLSQKPFIKVYCKRIWEAYYPDLPIPVEDE